jgi:hypothetical protein
VATANANNPYTRELHYTRELNALFSITNVGGVRELLPLRGLEMRWRISVTPVFIRPLLRRRSANSAGVWLRVTV